MKIWISECCDSLPKKNSRKGSMGLCGKCERWSVFYVDFWNKEEIKKEGEANEKE